MEIGNNLKLLRKRRKMSQEDVAKSLSLTRSSYSGYENNVAQPSLENLILLSDFFKISVDDVLKKDFSDFNENQWKVLEEGINSDVKGQKLRVLTTMVDGNNEELIELVNVKASAGYTAGYADPDYLKV